jgi:hypothetical protein
VRFQQAGRHGTFIEYWRFFVGLEPIWDRLHR